jgi:hypothetical protein
VRILWKGLHNGQIRWPLGRNMLAMMFVIINKVIIII